MRQSARTPTPDDLPDLFIDRFTRKVCVMTTIPPQPRWITHESFTSLQPGEPLSKGVSVGI